MSGCPKEEPFRGIIRFFLLFLLYMAIAFVAIQVVRAKTDVFGLFSIKVAQLSSWLVNLVGLESRAIGSVVFQDQGFAIDISYKCSGVFLIAFFSAGVLAYSCPFRKKFAGLLFGIPLIFLINLIRLVGLFLIGTFAMPIFDFVHKVFAEVLMILTTFVIWWLWLKRISLALSLEGEKN